MKNTLLKEEQARQRARVNRNLKTPYKKPDDVRDDSAYDQAHQLEGGSGLSLFNKAEMETGKLHEICLRVEH